MNKCLFSWGEQYDPNDFSGTHECELESGHEGRHRDGLESYDPDEDFEMNELRDDKIRQEAEIIAEEAKQYIGEEQ